MAVELTKGNFPVDHQCSGLVTKKQFSHAFIEIFIAAIVQIDDIRFSSHNDTLVEYPDVTYLCM